MNTQTQSLVEDSELIFTIPDDSKINYVVTEGDINSHLIEMGSADSDGFMRRRNDIEEVKFVYHRPRQTFHKRSRGTDGFHALQKWEGVVREIYGDYFTAILRDLTNGGTDEYAEIAKDDLSLMSDLDLLEENAVFYMSVGYQFVRGQRIKGVLIRFKRTPIMTEKQKEIQLNNTLDKANDLYDSLIWE